MQSSVEKVNSVERRLTITVPAQQVADAIDKQMKLLASQANFKGFRKGKAPKAMVEARYRQDAQNEALREVMQHALYASIEQNDLHPVSTPRIEPKTMLADQPLEFIASFEVLPEITNVNFKMDNIDKLNVAVSEDDIERVVTQLQKQYTKWKMVEREAKLHDRVVVDYYAIFEGKSDADNKIKNFPLELGSKVMLPGFEDGLVGVKAGEERTLNLTFPNNAENAANAGKPIEFVISAKQVMEAEMPAIDEALIKKLGVASGDRAELQKQIRQSLESERDRLVKEKLKEQVFTQLLEQNPIEVPLALVSREAKKIHDEVHPHDHDHHQHSHEEMTMFDEIAKKRVMLGLLIGAYSKQMHVTADEARVEARIKEIAAAYENPQEVVEWLSTDERRRGIASQVAEDMVLEKFMDGVSVTEKVMTYAELKGIHI